MPRLWVWLVLTAHAAGAQTPLPPEVLRLSRIKRHMAAVLNGQPNYTCLESIERSQRGRKSKRFQLIDALSLEVAVVEGKELFSWPGEREFKDRDLRELAPTGAIGTGSFAMHARSVFLGAGPAITYHGEEVVEGRTLSRYDYDVPQFRSGYLLRIGGLQGMAGYRGSFWNDLETFDLVRLDVETSHIPAHIPLRVATDSMRYERVPIGDSTFLLPKSSELTMEGLGGDVSRNIIRFSRCRQYAGESTLSFADVPEEGAAPAAAPAPLALPAGLPVEVELLTPVNFPGNAIGDQIEGRVRRDAKSKGVVIVPKGALLKGNIAVLERRSDSRGREGMLVALQWREISFDGKVGPFEGQLEDGGAILPASFSSRGIYQRPDVRAREALPHRDVFYVRKDSLQLPKGLPLIWRTRDAGSFGAKKP